MNSKKKQNVDLSSLSEVKTTAGNKKSVQFSSANSKIKKSTAASNQAQKTLVNAKTKINRSAKVSSIKNSTANMSTEKSHSQKKSIVRNQELSKFSLGQSFTEYPSTYAPEVLEAFANKNPDKIAWTTFICPEFTSLCPKTGQPDFACIYVNYIAGEKMVESKSLKLYLFSFRNHGDFHEDCVQTICDDLFALMQPKYIEVIGEFTPRGGISIYPFASLANSEKFSQELRHQRMIQYAPRKFSAK